MKSTYENIITLTAAIFLFYICYKDRLRKPNNIVQFQKRRKRKQKIRKYQIKPIEDSEIRNDTIQEGQDIRYEGYYNAAWEEANK